jgi:CO/xanthine dehydrogenase FAD-binding subunit
MGIRFEVGVDVGKDIALDDLKGRYDAVFFAAGTWRSLKLGVSGEEAEGVLYALEYLKKIDSGEKVHLGRRVIVIGGGSVAIDAARTARRLGAEEVHLVCLECRDLTSKDRMIALDSEILEAEEEGIIIHGSLGVKGIAVKNGKAIGLETMACVSVREADGTFNPQYDTTCTALSLEAESIIVAIGQAAELSLSALKESGSVFAGGDMVSGPSTVIQAVASGRAAAQRMSRTYGGIESSGAAEGMERDFVHSSFEEIPRVRIDELPVSQRLRSIDIEDMPGLTGDQIATEASRCFNCGCLAVGPSDLAMALVALDARVVTTKRSVPAQIFFSASATNSTILEGDELIKEIRIPKPPAGSRQRYDKFTLRKPVDFAIVSVASVLTLKDGVCKDARLILGAVAPKPLRVRDAEEILKGRTIDETTAAEVAEAALEGAQPLAMNDYKIEIAKTLVKRAILG